MEESSLSVVDRLAALAQQYGPYFFSVLFVVILTKIAYNGYVRAQERQKGPSEVDLKIMRYYFVGTVVFGVICSAAALAWWFFSNTRQLYTYKVTITEVTEPMTMTSSGQFYKPTQRQTVTGGPSVVDDEFLIVSRTPFVRGQKFDFDVWVNPPQPQNTSANAQLCSGGVGVITHQTVSATYGGETERKFKLVAEPSKPASLVVADAQRSVSSPESERDKLALRSTLHANVWAQISNPKQATK